MAFLLTFRLRYTKTYTCTNEDKPLLPAVPSQPPITKWVKAEVDKKLVTQEDVDDTCQYGKPWITLLAYIRD